MPANGLPFEFSDGNGANTRIDYAFRDGDVVVRESIVLEGRVSIDDVQGMAESLKEGCKFLPRKLGVPDLVSKMPSSWIETADPYHEIERISFTAREEDDFAPSSEQFVAMAENYEFMASWSSEPLSV